MSVRRQSAVAALGMGAMIALAACGGSSNGATNSSSSTTGQSAFNAAITSVVNPSSKTGGTLKLSATGDCDSWDGANMYYAWCWDMSRLYMRTLMAYQSKPGPTKVVPDLATGGRLSTTLTSRRGPTTSGPASSGRTARPSPRRT